MASRRPSARPASSPPPWSKPSSIVGARHDWTHFHPPLDPSGAVAVADFAGTERFEPRRRLGRGACGAVYEVLDRERGARVALKQLAHADAEARVRFKGEFRSIADLTHPNLVQLYELFSDGATWFFTMELVTGCDFTAYVRPRTLSAEGAAGEARDDDRLAAAILQVADGLSAIHAAGKVHRDIKPSNVLVSSNGASGGRVVIVDFGIAADLAAGLVTGGTQGSLDGGAMLGTPSFMAPEQVCMEEVGPPADVYALGVMLYAGLTGKLPFAGQGLDVLEEKLLRDPTPPSAIDPSIGAERSDLCLALMARVASERATLDDLRRVFGTRRAVPSPRPAPSWSAAGALVGREEQIGALRGALASATLGAPACVAVAGASGFGKSALVRAFLDDVEARDEAVVIEARCHERESMPHKTLDGFVDALTQYLAGNEALEEAVVPAHAAALARLFPAFTHLRAFRRVAAAQVAPNDPHQLRERAAAALAELLVRVCERQAVTMFIDDVQWGDADGAALLLDVLGRLGGARLLVVLAYRADDAASTPWLAELLGPAGVPARMPCHFVSIGPLSQEQSRALAETLLRPDLPGPKALAARIAEEAEGNPFFVGELARYARATRGGDGTAVRIADVVRARVASLPAQYARLLDVVAAAGRPLASSVAFRAAELEPEEGMRAVTALHAASLLRSTGLGKRVSGLECAHYRVREGLVAAMADDEVRRVHGRLAAVIVAEASPDPEALAFHFASAGDTDRAREHTIVAARRAAEAIAFDRAAALYESALVALPPGDRRERALRLELGDVLANAGRGAEAATEYTSVARGMDRGPERVVLQRRAAEELLFAGHVDRGLEAVGEVLTECGLPVWIARWRALLMLVILRLVLRVRGNAFARRDAAGIAPMALARADTLVSVGAGLSTIDNVIAAAYAAKSLLACMRLGDPWRVCRMICLEMQLESTDGPRAKPRVDRFLALARELAESIDRPDTWALVTAATGGTLLFNGHWRSGYEHMARALVTYEDRALNAAGLRASDGQNFTARWETDTFRYFSLAALFQLGRWAELSVRLDAYARDARRRGDLYLATNLDCGDSNIHWLMRDDPGEARHVIEEALARWSQRRFQMQHWYAMQSLTCVDLYEGDGEAALARVGEAWAPLGGSLLMRIQFIRVRALHLRARAEVAAAAQGGDRGLRAARLAAAARTSARLTREGTAWGEPLAALLDAAIAHQRGLRDGARDALVRAEAGFEAANMSLWAAAARFHRGARAEGGAGVSMRDEAARAFRAQGVKDVAKIVRMLAPGLDGEPGERAPG